MNYSKPALADQMRLLEEFAKHYSCHLAIEKAKPFPAASGDFWRLASEAHLHHCVRVWCMVFSDDPSANAEQIRAEFRKVLIANGTGKDTWPLLDAQMTSFRNQYSVPGVRTATSAATPPLAEVLSLAYVYDDWVRTAIGPDRLDNLPLRPLVATFALRAEAWARVAVAQAPPHFV